MLRCVLLTAQIFSFPNRIKSRDPTLLSSYHFHPVRYLLLVITFAQSDAVQISALKEPRLYGTALLKETDRRQR